MVFNTLTVGAAVAPTVVKSSFCHVCACCNGAPDRRLQP